MHKAKHMEQDLRNCPGCGALAPETEACVYCDWAPETRLPASASEATDPLLNSTHEDEHGQVPAAPSEGAQDEPAPESSRDLESSPQGASDSELTPFRKLIQAAELSSQAEELLDQVPEEMRGVLAARLKANEDSPEEALRDDTVASLRNQGFLVSEDARGARISGDSSAEPADLSPYQVVSLAAEQEGGVQPQQKLQMCAECQSASPAGSTSCQWCGEPFP